MTRPVFLHVFSTFGAAGPQIRTVEIIKALGPDSKHLILAMDGNTAAAALLPAGAPVELLPSLPKSGSFRTTLRLALLIKKTKPDLMLTYNFGAVDALLAARIRGGPPAIHHEDGFRPDEIDRLKLRRSVLRQIAFPSAAKVILVSETLRRIALDHWGQPPDRLAVIPNGIEAERFRPCTNRRDELRSRLGIPQGVCLVGTVGHLRPEKGQARLLAAVEMAIQHGADIHVLLAGDGPERARLEQLSRSAILSGKVHFLGHTSRAEDAYGAMDLYALTSDTEQMPISLLEAMAAGLPVVATDVGDVRRMLPPVQQTDVVGLDGQTLANVTDRLIKLVESPGQRYLLGTANSNHVISQYSLQVMIERYRSLYNEVVRAGSPQDNLEAW